MRIALSLSLAVALCALFARPAKAHPPPFWWMADTSDTSHFGFELLVGNPDLGLDTTTLSGGVFGHFAASPAVTVDVRLPLSFSYFDDPGILGEDSEAAIGNLSLGVQGHARRRNGFHSRMIYGGGFVIYVPTASDEGAAAFVAGAAGQLSIPDPGRWLVNTTTARLRGDMRFESNALFFQAELNLDLFFTDGDDDIDLALGVGPGVKLNEELALLMELSISNLDDDEQITVDLGMRYHMRTILAGFRLYLPLSDPFRDNDLIGAGFDIAGRF